MPTIHADLETRSAVDLKKTGVHIYANHPTTDVWCLKWAVDDGPIQLWIPGMPAPEYLNRLIADRETFCAHNVSFEYHIWRYIMVERYGFESLTLDQLDCTAARAAIQALPRSLEGCGQALGLDVQKDKKGHALMLRMAKPRKARKHEDTDVLVWWDDDERKQSLYDYCETDVVVERELDKRLRPMSDWMRKIWLMDFRLNLRGAPVDLPFVLNAKAVTDLMADDFDRKIRDLTGGAVPKTSDAGALRIWTGEQLGRQIDSLDKASLTDLLASPGLPDHVTKALTLRQSAGKSSNAKWAQFINRTDLNDLRTRETLLFHAASTGRWGGRGIQLHNLPSRTPVSATEIRQAIRILSENDPYSAYLILQMSFSHSVAEVLSACIRGAICTIAGEEQKVADYSNIEGRVNAWQAGEEWKLQAFRDFDAGTGPDLYKVSAAGIYGISVEDVTKLMRQIGKVSELALGYQGGPSAYDSMASNYQINIAEFYDTVIPNVDQAYVARAREAWANYGHRGDMIERAWLTAEVVKLAWRDKHPAIVQSWSDLELAAIRAVRSPGSVSFAAKVAFFCDNVNGTPFLMCRLPSGRLLYYCRPRVIDKKTPWGSVKPLMTYMSVNSTTKKWEQQSTYGGKWCIAQGTPVLTERGLVPIEDVTAAHRVWDGFEWVRHDGLARQGFKETIEAHGVRMTPEHEVLTERGWVRASQSERYTRANCRLPSGYDIPRLQREKIGMERGLHRLRGDSAQGSYRTVEAKEEWRMGILRVPAGGNCRGEAIYTPNVTPPRVRSLARYGVSLHQANASCMGKLRRAGASCVRELAALREFLERHGAALPAGTVAGEGRQRTGLLSAELPLGNADGTGEQPPKFRQSRDSGRDDYSSASSTYLRSEAVDTSLSAGPRMGGPCTVQAGRKQHVYDLVNAGPRRRFTVLDKNGLPLIVHNCENICQAISFDLMAEAMVRTEAAGYPPILSVHDEISAETVEGVGSLEDFERLMCELPAWAAGLPIATEGFVDRRYRK